MKHIPRKRFGQNFLKDGEVIAGIISAIAPISSDKVIEIGPGLGALTFPLLGRLDRLDVVEVDRDIVERLTSLRREKLFIHQADALKFDFSSLGGDLRVVGNLPYNISTPLLFHLSTFSGSIRDMHFMLQKEVIDRMIASPSTHDYGRLSVMLQQKFHMEKLFEVAPESFDPAPKVWSAIVRMIPIRGAREIPGFDEIVLAAFSQRRKTLRNTLKGILDLKDFEALGIDPQARAENLSVADYETIAGHKR